MSAAVTALCVVVNYVAPKNAFEILMMLVVAALVLNWLMISITHLKFRKFMQQEKRQALFPSIAAPWSNYLTIAFVVGILVIMAVSEEMRMAVILLPVWLVALSAAYILKYRQKENSILVLEQ